MLKYIYSKSQFILLLRIKISFRKKNQNNFDFNCKSREHIKGCSSCVYSKMWFEYDRYNLWSKRLLTYKKPRWYKLHYGRPDHLNVLNSQRNMQEQWLVLNKCKNKSPAWRVLLCGVFSTFHISVYFCTLQNLCIHHTRPKQYNYLSVSRTV